jgi:hypothetical protein
VGLGKEWHSSWPGEGNRVDTSDNPLLPGGRCIAAGVAQVRCIVRTDLAGDTRQVLAMLAENTRRRALSVVEEARGYHQRDCPTDCVTGVI